MLHWRAGTSGFAYKQWVGTFYPEGTKSAEMLTRYAEQLPLVEINNTFYRMPRSSVIETWRDSTPADFRFIIKASRRITHQAKLQDTEESIAYLCERLRLLEDKLACVLLQLPPFLKHDQELLHRFVDSLPDDIPFAFEFRSSSWFVAPVFSLLQERGHMLCLADGDKLPMPEFSDAGEPANQIPLATNSSVYLRLRRAEYTDADLQTWQQRITQAGVNEALVLFKHEDAGAGPALARHFLELCGP